MKREKNVQSAPYIISSTFSFYEISYVSCRIRNIPSATTITISCDICGGHQTHITPITNRRSIIKLIPQRVIQFCKVAIDLQNLEHLNTKHEFVPKRIGCKERTIYTAQNHYQFTKRKYSVTVQIKLTPTQWSCI